MRLRRKRRQTNDENIIPLINIVFLMLIFFLVAGALRPFQEEGITPAQANAEHEKERPLQPVMIDAEGANYRIGCGTKSRLTNQAVPNPGGDGREETVACRRR